MDCEPGSFYDNCEMFNGVMRAIAEGRDQDGRRAARRLLAHIRRGHDEKSKRCLADRLAPFDDARERTHDAAEAAA